MPGTFILKPIEANLTHNTEFLFKMSPYCSVVIGDTKVKGEICKKGGKHPHWNDSITVPVANESKVLVELMDKDKITHDDNIGSFILDLKEVQSSGHLSRWYSLTHKNKPAGEILVDALYEPAVEITSSPGVIAGKNQYYEQEKIVTAAPEVTKKEEIVTTTTTTTTTQEVPSADIYKHTNVWTEQHQVIEPHTFVKEVEVVETHPVMKEIEVMEPVKVLKDVQYTEAVHVKKHIDVAKPKVVIKEVEVIEPRLVTKTIQVIENVPVIRRVEVVEMENVVEEVDAVEPQTFHKQIEVTEYVSVRKQVEVSEPVTLKKAVEYVEPVITTQTITKEVREPVIVSEEMSTTVGPASVIGVSNEYRYVGGYGQMTISDQQRLSANQRWVGYSKIFDGLNDNEKFYEQQRLSLLSEKDWVAERKRLLVMSQEERLTEQRRLYGVNQSAGGSSYTKTSQFVQKTVEGDANMNQKSQYYQPNAPNVYHTSPNF